MDNNYYNNSYVYNLFIYIYVHIVEMCRPVSISSPPTPFILRTSAYFLTIPVLPPLPSFRFCRRHLILQNRIP